jgi:cytochrome c-type biogenesis protein CcmE
MEVPVSGMLAARRRRLVAIMVLATAAVSVLVVVAAGSSFSYYVTPEEFREHPNPENLRWRVAGRVIGESIVEHSGRPVGFTIRGYEGATVDVVHSGIYPTLFGPNALVIVEGVSDDDHIEASSVIIKHEDEFFIDSEDSPAYVPKSQ